MGQGNIKYRKVKRTPQTGENAGKELWYATVVTDREMNFEEFVDHIFAQLALQPRHRARRDDGHARLLEGAYPRRQERSSRRPRPLLHRHEISWRVDQGEGFGSQRGGHPLDCEKHP